MHGRGVCGIKHFKISKSEQTNIIETDQNLLNLSFLAQYRYNQTWRIAETLKKPIFRAKNRQNVASQSCNLSKMAKIAIFEQKLANARQCPRDPDRETYLKSQ